MLDIVLEYYQTYRFPEIYCLFFSEINLYFVKDQIH